LHLAESQNTSDYCAIALKEALPQVVTQEDHLGSALAILLRQNVPPEHQLHPRTSRVLRVTLPVLIRWAIPDASERLAPPK